MIPEKVITLSLYDQPIEARIVNLTPELADDKVMIDWWGDDCLMHPLPEQIDRYWNWTTYKIEWIGDQVLAAEKVAVVTGEGEDLAVQGAMMVSTDPVQTVSGEPCLLLELLFTAPRNRPYLRQDKKPFVVGVGTQLLICAANLSRERGYGGRLRLDASPDFVSWYEKRRLQKAKSDPILYQGVSYTPMELLEDAAQKVLSAWDEA